MLSLNTRLPEDFKLNQRNKQENQAPINIALTNEERALAKEKRDSYGPGVYNEQTPIVNGYKIISDTPKYFKIPSTPLREELGLQLAQASEIKKRNSKQQEKE